MGKRKPEKTVKVWNAKGEEVELPLSTAKDLVRNDGKGEGGNTKKFGWTLKNPAQVEKENAAKQAVQDAIAAQNAVQQGEIGVDPSPTVTKGLAKLNALRAEANRLNIAYENTWGTVKLQAAINNAKVAAGAIEAAADKPADDTDEFGDGEDDDDGA